MFIIQAPGKEWWDGEKWRSDYKKVVLHPTWYTGDKTRGKIPDDLKIEGTRVVKWERHIQCNIKKRAFKVMTKESNIKRLRKYSSSLKGE